MAAAFVGGIGFDLFTVTWETALHQHVRPERLSRVASYDMLGSFIAIPAGQALAGTAADAFQAAPVILTAAAVYVLVGAAALCTTQAEGCRGLLLNYDDARRVPTAHHLRI